MQKLASCIAVLGLFILVGCTEVSDPVTDNTPPDIGEQDAVSVDRTSPEAPNPNPPEDPLVEFIATHQADSRNLVAHQEALYWIDEGTGATQVRGVAIENGSWGVLAKLDESPFDMIGFGDALYVTSPFAQVIHRVDLVTGEVTVFASFKNESPLALATDRETIFASTTAGRVIRVSDDGKKFDVLATVSDTAVQIAVRDSDVFFGTVGGALHRTLTEPGFGSIKVSSTHGFAGGVVIDDQYVYWASDIERLLMRLDRFGGDPEVVIDQLFGLTGVATDGGFVYVTTQGDNAIRRFATNSEIADDTLEIVGTEFRAPAEPIVSGGTMFFVSEDAAAIGKLLQ